MPIRKQVDWANRDPRLARARQMFYEGASYGDIHAETGMAIETLKQAAIDEAWGRSVGAPGGLADESVTDRKERMRSARLASKERYDQASVNLAEQLMGNAAELAHRMFERFKVHEVKTVATGNGTSETEIVSFEIDSPTPSDQRAMADAISKLVDKAQLLSGEATERSEDISPSTREEREARLGRIVDDLQVRRERKTG